MHSSTGSSRLPTAACFVSSQTGVYAALSSSTLESCRCRKTAGASLLEGLGWRSTDLLLQLIPSSHVQDGGTHSADRCASRATAQSAVIYAIAACNDALSATENTI